MTFKSHACLEVVCDSGAGCDPWEDHDGGIPHFPDEAAARKYLDDWRWRDDGTVICPACAADEDCDRLGHQWVPFGNTQICERCNEFGPSGDRGGRR